MVNVFLIVLVSIAAFILLGVCVFILVYYGHPDDTNGAKVPKIVTVVGLWLSFASVLVLPYDVANSRGEGGGLQIDILWQILYISFAVLLSLVIPFAFFFYENDVDPSEVTSCGDGQCGRAAKDTAVFFVVFAILLAVLYATSRTAAIPITRYAMSPALVSPIGQNVTNQGTKTFIDTQTRVRTTASLEGCQTRYGCVEDTFKWKVDVTFPLYVMALLAFIGWLFFTFFVGVGFFALPMDLINAYRTRPIPMTSVTYAEQGLKISERAQNLHRIAQYIKTTLGRAGGFTRTERRKSDANIKKFYKHYYFLKKDIEILETAYRLKGGNPLVPIFQLILGIISIILTITWIIHIILYVLPSPPLHPFLNNFFVALEEAFGSGNFSLFGVLAFAIYSFYLLACAVKGNFKLGIRFLFWKIYPMELHKTMMNAFLVNTWIIMLTSVPTVQFCAWAFPIYARYTDINLIFGQQIKYLPGFRELWVNNVFIYIMIIVAFLSLFVFIISPNDTAKKIDEELAELVREAGNPPRD
jgi:LMBR1 domain-containing protein 1